MTKYRKKQVEIEAVQYVAGMEDGFRNRYSDHNNPTRTFGIKISTSDTLVRVPYLKVFEGDRFISGGDWIITCPNGERRLVKNATFQKTYEVVK